MAWFGKKKKQDDDAAKVGFIWSTNALLRVAAPAGSAWRRMEATPRPPLIAGIKCVRGAPPDAIALDATATTSDVTIDDIRARDWRAHFSEKMFATIVSLEVIEVEHAMRAGFNEIGCEILVEGELREPKMDVLVRERYVPSRGELLVVSAVASPQQHRVQEKLIDSWLMHASLGG